MGDGHPRTSCLQFLALMASSLRSLRYSVYMSLREQFAARLAIAAEKLGRAVYLGLAAIGTRIGVFEIVPSTFMFDLVLGQSDTECGDLGWSIASPREENQ